MIEEVTWYESFKNFIIIAFPWFLLLIWTIAKEPFPGDFIGIMLVGCAASTTLYYFYIKLHEEESR